jgi:hypothetical protein
MNHKLSAALSLILACLVFGNLTSLSVSAQANKRPAGWFFGGDPASFKAGQDSKIVQNGLRSATIESLVQTPPNFSTLMQTMVVKDFTGQRIKMTGYIRSEGTDVAGSMWIRVDDLGNKKVADFDNMMDRPVTGNSSWTKCEIIFDVPENCMINFGFIFQGNGKIWVDNVTFEKVDKSVEKTATDLDQPFPSEYLEKANSFAKGLPEMPPANLDFEEDLFPAVSQVIMKNPPQPPAERDRLSREGS